MSFEGLIVRYVNGERRFGRGELPLRLGTGGDCQVRLPGPGGAPVAMLDLLDGQPIVQPVGHDTSMRINDATLDASRRLLDGDVLQFYGSEIRVVIDDSGIVIDIRLEDSAYVTKPPEVADEDRPDDESIAPTAFRRVAETAAQDLEDSRSLLKMIVGVALVALLSMSFLLFTSKSVEFEVDPAEPDSLAIKGGWFHLPIGNRTLLRSGNYTVNVEK